MVPNATLALDVDDDVDISLSFGFLASDADTLERARSFKHSFRERVTITYPDPPSGAWMTINGDFTSTEERAIKQWVRFGDGDMPDLRRTNFLEG